MNLTTWNVNSIRARKDRVLAWFDAHHPDIVCMQETKCTDADFPFAAFHERGYEVVHHGQKAYNGVAIVSRLPLSDVVVGVPDPTDPQARGVAARVGGLRVCGVYVVNGGALDSDKYTYKLDWMEKLLAAARPWAAEGGFVLCGDFNVAPEDADCFDPDAWRGDVLVSEPERARYRALLGLGLIDTFRRLDRRPKQYTWWDYRGDMFNQNKGLRIDHHLVTPDVTERLLDVAIDTDERAGVGASDHAPVTLFLRD